MAAGRHRRSVTFAGIDFSEAPKDQIDFSGFEFGDHADFSECKWRGGLPEDHAVFVPGMAFFAGAKFGAWAKFTCADFGSWADFTGANFGPSSDFDGAIFGDFASFRAAYFGAGPRFCGAFFGDYASFEGATFGNWAIFDKAVFKGNVEFNGKHPADIGLDGNISRWRCDRFSDISFAGTRFDGEANFTGRSFERTANFSNARFYYPPDFDAATNHARIDFTGAHVGFVAAGKWLHWTENSRIPVRLRAFRKIAEETKNHDLERDLYIEERNAERGVYLRQRWEELKKEGWKNWPRNAARLFSHLLWIVVMFGYWGLADYGRSFVRPLVALIASVFFFDWGYRNDLAHLMPKACPQGDQYERALGMLALGNAVPFVGPLTIDTKIKEFLFCPNNAASCLPPIPPEGFQFLVIFQNLFSITCVFFIALALRNYFKIK